MTDWAAPAGAAGALTSRATRLRWAVVLAPVGIYFFSYFHRIAPAVVVEDLMRTFAVSGAMVGLLTAVYPWLFGAMALPAGSLADTLGSRWTLTAGSAFMAAGAVVFGLAPTFGWAIAGRLLIGLGSSAILIAWLRLGSAWCRPREMATFGGMSQTVGALGALVGTAPLAALVGSLGWRASFLAIGALTAATGVLVALVVRDRPQALGLPPIGGAPAAAAMSLAEIVRSVRAVIANRRSWPPVLATAGMYSTFLLLVGLWGVPYLTQVYGVSRLTASGYTAWSAVGVLLGGLSVGWISDRLLVRRRLPMLVFAAVYAGLWMLLLLPEALRVPVGWLGPFFLAFGFTNSAVGITFAAVTEANDPARPGIAIGFCNVPTFTALALLQWVSGAMLDAAGGTTLPGGVRVYPFSAYRTVFVLCTTLAVLAVAAAAAMTETRCRNVWTPPRPSRRERALGCGRR